MILLEQIDAHAEIKSLVGRRLANLSENYPGKTEGNNSPTMSLGIARACRLEVKRNWVGIWGVLVDEIACLTITKVCIGCLMHNP